jgi:7,8-dihydropterin-6-yl-methyl-4-(beta-D-ribofuranosyl)aminobenzene 5'-phosphate synthase
MTPQPVLPAATTCEKIVIRVLDELYSDMLLTDRPMVRRFGMPDHFRAGSIVPWAENGLSYLIDVYARGRRQRILFDAGFSHEVVLHNLGVLQIDPASIDLVVLSHGHPDHARGVPGVLRAIGGPRPLIVHPDAFIPRYIALPTTHTMPYINMGFGERDIEDAGGRLMLARGPVPIALGAMTSGEIERLTDFEHEVPAGRFHLPAGEVCLDEIVDDLALYFNVAGFGLVVVSGCGHSGIVNTIRHGQKLTGVDRVGAVIGGFHLGHPGISDGKIRKTSDALVEMAPELVAPMHCSGFRTWRVLADSIPDAFTTMTVAATITIGAEA